MWAENARVVVFPASAVNGYPRLGNFEHDDFETSRYSL